MSERRKIIIETGAEPSEPLSTPHFDTEATLTARPVVPLTDQEPYRTNYGDYRARAAKPFWKRPALLIPIILAAVGIGVAAGFAIGLYRSRSAAQPPVATAPTPATENTDLSQTVEEQKAPETEARATVPDATDEPEEEPAVAEKDEERERNAARNERKDDDNKDDDNEARPAVVVAKPPASAREKKPIKVDEYEIENSREERRAEKERRREERREDRRERRRRQREEELSIPRGIERGVREADRIREIFEGRQP